MRKRTSTISNLGGQDTSGSNSFASGARLLAESATREAGVEHRRAETKSTPHFTQCFNIAQKHGLKLQDVRAHFSVFNQLDVDGDGVLTIGEVMGHMRAHCNAAEGTAMPEHVMQALRLFVQKSARVDFESFLLWRRQSEFLEEVSVPDTGDRRLRQLARDLNVSILDFEAVVHEFKSVDEYSAGFISEKQFGDMLKNLRRHHGRAGLRLRQHWEEVSKMRSMSAVPLRRVLIWYFTMFMKPSVPVGWS